MFFLVGGVHPKTVTLDDNRRICPACGLAQAYLKRVDHYLNLFFIPLFRVKKGEPVLICERCGAVSRADAAHGSSPVDGGRSRCRWCGEPLEERFNYCPNCGREV